MAFTGKLVFAYDRRSSLTVSLAGSGAGEALQPPSITSQPLSRTVTAGQSAAFSVIASGTAPFSYQWRKNGTSISGATSSSYTIPAATTSDTGTQFTVLVSNAAGSATSSAATLTVNATTLAPSITSHPVSRTVAAGQAATFSVSVSGTAPFSYQWRKNGANISGATSSSYTTPAATTADTGTQFTVVASNVASSITSNPATLTVTAPSLLLTVSPASLSFGSVYVGGSSTQAVTVTNSGDASVTFSGIASSGPGFSTSGISSGQILGPGQTAKLNVTFSPSSTGNVAGSITVASNSSNSPRTVSVSGSGVQPQSHRALLTWSPSTSSVVGYQVYASSVSGGPYTRVTNAAVNTASYTDATVQSGETYYYVVTAVDSSATESAYSTQVRAVIP
jgi:hypothetical protein